MINPILEPEDYQAALDMAFACNFTAILNWLDARIDTVAAAYPNDTEYATRVHHIANRVHNNFEGVEAIKEHGTAWLWEHTWTEKRWQIASDPAVALAVQVLANIGGWSSSRCGYADDDLYSQMVDHAWLFANTVGIMQTTIPSTFGNIYSTTILADDCPSTLNEYNLTRLLQRVNNVLYDHVEWYVDGGGRYVILGTSDEPFGDHLSEHLTKWAAKSNWFSWIPEEG